LRSYKKVFYSLQDCVKVFLHLRAFVLIVNLGFSTLHRVQKLVTCLFFGIETSSVHQYISDQNTEKKINITMD